jgi:hypothetical protein
MRSYGLSARATTTGKINTWGKAFEGVVRSIPQK